MEALTKDSFVALSTVEQVVRLEQVDARTRQQLIVSSPNSLALTRSLSSEKLFYTLKEIGLADAVDLLALAAPEQIRDMIDLDCWRRDTLDNRRVAAWLMMLDEAGSGKLAEWALHTDIELLVLLVMRHFEVVRKADVEEDPDFNFSLYFTFDDQYLLRFIGEAEPILSLVLERLRVLDYESYKQVLEWSLHELDSALEEDALHWRNARFADRGYPAYDEARALFRFIEPEALPWDRYRRATVTRVRYASGEEVIPSDHALMLLDVRDSVLMRALAALPYEQLEEIGHELAMLTNEVVVAEACDPGEVAEVRKCAEAVHDYINIGLAYRSRTTDQDVAPLLAETLLRPLLQVGISLTLHLQQRALELEKLLQQQVGELWTTLLDSPFRETYTGVHRRPPMFFRGLETPGEIFFRRFQNLTEINRVETLLTQIPLWFAALSRWRLLPQFEEIDQDAAVSLALVWNTAFARWVINKHVAAHPLTRTELIAFCKRMTPTARGAESERFLSFASSELSLSAEETEALQALASFAQEKLADVFTTDAAKVDLRFIEGLRVQL